MIKLRLKDYGWAKRTQYDHKCGDQSCLFCNIEKESRDIVRQID